MNRKVYNIILGFILAISIFLVFAMKNSSQVPGYIAIVPYILVFLSVWLLLSINMLKTAIKNMYIVPTGKRAETFGKLMKKSFCVEIFIKKQELLDVYHHIISLAQISYGAKVKVYEAYESKGIYVPYPSVAIKSKKNKR